MNNNERLFPLEFNEEQEELFNTLKNTTLSRKAQKVIAGLSLTIALVIFSIIAALSYRYTAKGVDFRDIKIIKADANPLKIAPNEPTGVQFRNQDKLIYEAIEKRSKPAVNKVSKKQPEPQKKPVPTKAVKQKSSDGVFGLLQ